ncbi:MAG: hypothetical protein ACRELE_06095 [Gemmatimonadales bacterium]
MRIRHLMFALCATALVSGCHKPRPKEVDLSQVLPNIPLPPDPEPLVRETGTNAMQFVIASRAVPDSVVAYYRRVLSADPFRLMNERTAGKVTSFYAEQNGPSIWISVSPNGTEGSLVIIAGASDSSKIASH